MVSLEVGGSKAEVASHAMGWLEFIATMTKSLAWPIVVILIFIMFQKEIRERIRDILKLSLPGVAAEFDKKADEVKSSLVNASSPEAGLMEVAGAAVIDFLAIHEGELESSTNESYTNVGKILSAWNRVEDVVRQRLHLKTVEPSSLSGSRLLLAARTQQLITFDQFNSLKGLFAMRNLAAHGRAGEINASRVAEFVVLANAIVTVLEMTPPPSNPQG